MISRAPKARLSAAWLGWLGLFLLAVLSPSLASASVSSRYASSLSFDDPALPQLPTNLEQVERRAADRTACGAFCGESRPLLSTQDAWGNYRFPSELAASNNHFGFTGYEFDKETGLYNAKARYFDPQLGRFLNQDSLLGQIDTPPSLHRYFYGRANPLRYIDLSGHADAEAKDFQYALVRLDTYQTVAMIKSGETVNVVASQDPAYALPQMVGRKVAPLNRAAEVGVRVAGVAVQGTAAVALGPTPAGVYLGIRAADEGQALARELWTGRATQSEAHQGIQIAIRETTGADPETAGLLAGGTLMVLDAGVGLGGAKGLPKSQPTTKPLEGIATEGRSPGSGAKPALDPVPTTTNPDGASGGAAPNSAPLPSRPSSSPYYSTWYEAELKAGTLKASDANHFRQANRQLYQRLQSDPVFAEALERDYPGITEHVTPGPRGGVADTAPPGTSWHHEANRPATLQLVPRSEHQAPGPIQGSLHPEGRGGRENWGGGRRPRPTSDEQPQ